MGFVANRSFRWLPFEPATNKRMSRTHTQKTLSQTFHISSAFSRFFRKKKAFCLSFASNECKCLSHLIDAEHIFLGEYWATKWLNVWAILRLVFEPFIGRQMRAKWTESERERELFLFPFVASSFFVALSYELFIQKRPERTQSTFEPNEQMHSVANEWKLRFNSNRSEPIRLEHFRSIQLTRAQVHRPTERLSHIAGNSLVDH